MSAPKPKRVFLGMPSYDGSTTMPAAHGFYRATRRCEVMRSVQVGSLLANTFNALWCQAHNCDPVPDYFAMQHADIEPEEWWLDTLIDEMEACDLDVLGVPVPIKNESGVTSIALHRDGDDWRPLCRLTLAEIHELPETFTSEDVGHPLLLNTGLWVCRFDPAWALQTHFTVNDRIVRSEITGKMFAQVESEDWYFSRNLHALGLRIGCTRKVQVMHRGGKVYSNADPWGQPYDMEFINHSQVAALAAEPMEV